MSEQKKSALLEMAEELDGMDRDVTSGEANLLEEILNTLRAGRELKPKDEAKLELMHEKYLGQKDDPERSPFEDRSDEIDPDYFV